MPQSYPLQEHILALSQMEVFDESLAIAGDSRIEIMKPNSSNLILSIFCPDVEMKISIAVFEKEKTRKKTKKADNIKKASKFLDDFMCEEPETSHQKQLDQFGLQYVKALNMILNSIDTTSTSNEEEEAPSNKMLLELPEDKPILEDPFENTAAQSKDKIDYKQPINWDHQSLVLPTDNQSKKNQMVSQKMMKDLLNAQVLIYQLQGKLYGTTNKIFNFFFKHSNSRLKTKYLNYIQDDCSQNLAFLLDNIAGFMTNMDSLMNLCRDKLKLGKDEEILQYWKENLEIMKDWNKAWKQQNPQVQLIIEVLAAVIQAVQHKHQFSPLQTHLTDSIFELMDQLNPTKETQLLSQSRALAMNHQAQKISNEVLQVLEKLPYRSLEDIPFSDEPLIKYRNS